MATTPPPDRWVCPLDWLPPDALAALPAATPRVDVDGATRWYLPDGQLHRLDGPAVEMPDGTRGWYALNRRHRADGPAIEEVAGTRQWWWAGEPHLWTLPAALWAHEPTRTALMATEEADEQQAHALTLFPGLPPDLQRTAVAEALADRNARTRLWGLRAAALIAGDPAPPRPAAASGTTRATRAPRGQQ